MLRFGGGLAAAKKKKKKRLKHIFWLLIFVTLLLTSEAERENMFEGSLKGNRGCLYLYTGVCSQEVQCMFIPLALFSLQGPDFCISHEDFSRLVLPSLSDQDTVLLLYTHSGEGRRVLISSPLGLRANENRRVSPSQMTWAKCWRWHAESGRRRPTSMPRTTRWTAALRRLYHQNLSSMSCVCPL